MNRPVCFIGSDEIVKLLGTKATVSDLEFRHFKELTIIRPLGDKIKSLIQAVNLSEYVVIELNEINKELGELIILLDLLTKPGEFIVPVNKQFFIEQVQTIIKDTSLKYPFRVIKSNDDIKSLKEDLMKIEPKLGNEELVIIDHFFNVKNVGTVALGFIKGGNIKVKDKFKLLPGGRDVQINSMQSMDVDYKELNDHARVGLSIKNCDIKDLERGSILTKTLEETGEIKGKLIKSKFCKDIKGKVMAVNGLLVRQGELGESLVLDKQIVITSPTIIYDENSSPRILGIIKEKTL